MLIRLVYSFLLTLLAPFFLYRLYKPNANKPKIGARWKEHFGRVAKLPQHTHQPIWIHAVSVGEVIAATPFIKKLAARQPNIPIVVTTTTTTGAAQVAKLGDCVEHRYMPLDFSFAVQRFIKQIQPSKLLIMETELWPNTLHCAAKANIPITIINARLSERSCLRYKKVNFIFRQLETNIHKFLCQTDRDAERFIRLGVAKAKVKVTGSLKFDISISDTVYQQADLLRAELGTNRPIWIAASTHKGEDETVFEAHQLVLKNFPNALLIIVPRHPERFLDVGTLACTHNLAVITRSSHQKVLPTTQVYLADTMGEMLCLIAASDLCFMGGSLLGSKKGGHNLLEPAALAKPCLTGPSFYNFQKITDDLLNKNGCVICATVDEIALQVTELFSDPSLAKAMGSSALKVVDSNKGALELVLNETLNSADSASR